MDPSVVPPSAKISGSSSLQPPFETAYDVESTPRREPQVRVQRRHFHQFFFRAAAAEFHQPVAAGANHALVAAHGIVEAVRGPGQAGADFLEMLRELAHPREK